MRSAAAGTELDTHPGVACGKRPGAADCVTTLPHFAVAPRGFAIGHRRQMTLRKRSRGRDQRRATEQGRGTVPHRRSLIVFAFLSGRKRLNRPRAE